MTIMSDLRGQLLSAFLGERDDHLAAMRAALGEAARSGFDGLDMEDVYRRAHSLKGAARAVDLLGCEAVAHRLETLLDALYGRRIAWTPGLLGAARAALDAIEDLSTAALEGRGGDAAPAVAALDRVLREHGLEIPGSALPDGGAAAAPEPVATQLRVGSEALDALMQSGALLLAELAHQDDLAAQARRLRDALAGLARRAQHARNPLAAELLRLGRVGGALHAELEDRGWRLEHLSRGLQGDLEQARLMPLDSVLAGLPSMVRNLARDLGKQVRVDVEGLSLRADRAVLQQLAEPLLHLLRNAVVHGLETPEQRRAAGKETEGRVLLQAVVRGGRLLLRVEDDGRGLDLRALTARGIAARLLTPEEAAEAPPERLRELIFAPGLTTAASLSALAGRGMGMDIVRQKVARLLGHIAVDSRPGRGTRFDLSLPLSLISQRLLLVRLAGQVFALPSSAVRRLAAVPRDAVLLLEGRPVVRIDDEEAPLVWLAPLLGLPAPDWPDTLALLLCGPPGAAIALAVDALEGVADHPVSSLPPGLERRERLGGTALLASGTLALVLEPSALLRDAATSPSPPPRAAAERPPPCILVVDDSVTTRTLEKSILEAHGYRVLVAVNGREALDRLAAGDIAVVISDIEMPQMDGFALLQSIKQDARLRHIPVILVTSRDNERDRERGLHLGADAYIVKKGFNQEDLLETIRQCTG